MNKLKVTKRDAGSREERLFKERQVPGRFAYTWLTLAFLIWESYHIYLMTIVFLPQLGNPSFDQSHLVENFAQSILLLVPSYYIAFYGLVLCLSRDPAKIYKKAWFFQLLTLIYFYLIGLALY